jgi:hypothetical protein
MSFSRVSDPSSEGNPPRQPGTETSDRERDGSGLLSARSAAILGASFLIAVIAGVLAYLTLGRSPADLAGAGLAAGTAFAGAVRLLMAIIT